MRGVSLDNVKSRKELASLVSLFLMLRLLIFGRIVSMILIINVEDMLNCFKTLPGFCTPNVFSIIYLSCIKSIFKSGKFSKAILAGFRSSSSLIIICSIEFKRFCFLGRGCRFLADSFNLVASVPVFDCTFCDTVGESIGLLGLSVIEVSWWLML